MIDSLPRPAERPRLRGVSHQYAFFVSLVAGVLLLAKAAPGAASTTTAIYVCSLSALLGTSAVYHRVTWSREARQWMARVDHSMIALLIAGTYTPFGVLTITGSSGPVLLAMIWGAAIAGIGLHMFWTGMPKRLSAVVYVVMGWVGVAAVPQLVLTAGWLITGLLLGGGLLYSVGAVIYARKRPDPVPGVFGYHEVFHALVIVAATSHFAAVALTVVPSA